MEFAKSFSSEEVKSWLEQKRFSPTTVERISRDSLDGNDIIGVFKDDDECRFYLPDFKERTRFKSFVKAEAQGNQQTPCTPSANSTRNLSPSCAAEIGVSNGGASNGILDAEGSENDGFDADHENDIEEVPVSLVSSTPKSKDKRSQKETPPSSKKVEDWIHKFQLPSRFSASVEDGLKNEALSINLQNEFIRDVCIAILNFTRYPTKAERVCIAKMIVKQYPCMGDKKILDTSSTWGSIEVKLMNRMKQLQRPKRLIQENGSEEKSVKRPKPSLDAWSQKPPLPEGETVETLKEFLKKQLPSLSRKKDVRSHRDFLNHTFALRRMQILDNPSPVCEVLESYPSLKQFVHLKGELCRIFEDDDIPQNIRSKDQKNWGPKILKYAENKKEWGSHLDVMKTALSDKSRNPSDVKDQTVLVLINKILKQKGKGPQQEVFTILPRNASVDGEFEKFVQPQIVAIGEGYELDELYIVCEGSILCSIPQESIIESIIALLSSFYIFNMEYRKSKAILSFLETACMGIGRGHTLLSVTTLFNDITDL